MKVTLLDSTKDPAWLISMAARRCYASRSKDTPEGRFCFIKGLIKAGHETPLEFASVSFDIDGISRSCMAQLTRHRIASFCVESQRYVSIERFSENNSKENVEKFVELYNKGASRDILQHKFGCSDKIAKEILSNNNCVERKIGDRGTTNPYIFLPENLTHTTAQLLGLIAADGCVHVVGENSISLTVKMKDEEYVRQISRIIGASCLKAEKGLFSTRKNSVSIGRTLIDIYGIVPNKSLVIKGDLLEKNLPERFVKDFILGYLEGNGSLLFYPKGNKKMLVFCSGSKQILEWIEKKISTNCKVNQRDIKKKTRSFQLIYQGAEQIKGILTWIYSDASFDLLLQRKFEKAVELGLSTKELLPKMVNAFENKHKIVIPPSFLGIPIGVLFAFVKINEAVFDYYNDWKGIVKNEDRRFILPNATKTNLSMCMNFRELRHFLKLRLDKKAQWEVQQVAYQIYKICQEKWGWLVFDINYEQ